MVLQVIIPMAGLGSRFVSQGFQETKFLLPMDGEMMTPMIELAVTSLKVSVPCRYFFIINESEGEDTRLRGILAGMAMKYGWDYTVRGVPGLTEGPASTVYHIHDVLDMEAPLLVVNSDQVLSWDFEAFWERCVGLDGCVLTYTPSYELVLGATDKHSFVVMDGGVGDGGVGDGGVGLGARATRFAEKTVLSPWALVGVHYFRTGEMFMVAYMAMVSEGLRAPNGEFYLSLVYEMMVRGGGAVGMYEVGGVSGTGRYYPVGEPGDYFHYLETVGGWGEGVVRDRLLGYRR